MTLTHDKARAKRMLRFIAVTEKHDAPLRFGIGTLASKIAVANFSGRGSPSAARDMLSDSLWLGSPKLKEEKPSFRAITCGYARLVTEGGSSTLVLQCKGSAQTITASLRKYFKNGFNLNPIWDQVRLEREVDSDTSAVAQLPPESELLSLFNEDDLDSRMAGIVRPEGFLESFEDHRDAEPDAARPAVDAANGDGTPSEDNAEELSAQPSKAEPAAVVLPAGVVDSIRTHSATIAGHVMASALQIGEPAQAAMVGVEDRLEAWLTRAAEALPPQERDLRVSNMTVRLLAMLRYQGALHDIQLTDLPQRPSSTPDVTEDDGDGAEDLEEDDEGLERPGWSELPANKINRIELRDVGGEPVMVRDIVEPLYNEALISARSKLFPFDLETASSLALHKFVEKKWKQDDDAASQIAQMDRLRENLRETFFQNENGLVGMLGVGKAKLTSEKAQEALIRRLAEQWSAMHEQAAKDLQDFKRSVQKRMTDDFETTVEEAGGKWDIVDSFLGVLSPKPFHALVAKLLAATDESRFAVMDEAAALVANCLEQLSTSWIAKVMDGLGSVIVWAPAAADLRQISNMLADLRKAG